MQETHKYQETLHARVCFATSTPLWLQLPSGWGGGAFYWHVVSVNLLAERRFPITIVARVSACGRGSN